MKERSHCKPITPYDPHSNMHYRIKNCIIQKGGEDSQYGEISENLPNKKMSKLDKVALNMMYLPSISPWHEPVKAGNGMYYCKRISIANHNQPGGSPIGICQPADPDNLGIEGGPI